MSFGGQLLMRNASPLTSISIAILIYLGDCEFKNSKFRSVFVRHHHVGQINFRGYGTIGATGMRIVCDCIIYLIFYANWVYSLMIKKRAVSVS